MFRENSINFIEAEWTETNSEQSTNRDVDEIDRALRRIAQEQAAIDSELSRWLRRAEELNIWPQLGYVHALEYLEDVFGLGPHAATERVRVARELGELPELEEALASGDLRFGVVRELTRVATRETVTRWLEKARGRRLREVEQMVAGRKKGDGPEARPDPNRIKHRLSLELDGESMAAWRQMRMAFEDELGDRLDDRTFVLELAGRYLAGTSSPPGNENEADDLVAHEVDGERRSCKPMHMIHISTCRDCRRSWQHGAGQAIEISASALEHAECDAIIVDDEKGERAAWSIPPATKRLVMERDQWCCQVPGCRAARFLAVHHIIHREHGGTNDPWNLLVLCSGHHRLHHDGVLEITGRAPDQLEFSRRGVSLLPPAAVFTPPTAALVPVPRSVRASNENIQLAKEALQQLGFTAPIARRAVELACESSGAELDLGALIKEALRKTPL
ncbi:MAG TPA: HNH endonuclease [Kofleriaceae bacterium]|nr:HNH endonuclease [Kofleriaceae bacterium]